jgi:uncharacterized membrane-anchored protein
MGRGEGVKRPGLRLAIVVAIQFLILLGLLGFKQYTVLTGETVALRVQPVDPTDLFRGDYATLRYDISRLNLSQLEGDDDFGHGDRIYVELVKGDPGWQPVAAYRDRHQEHKPSVVLKGKVTSRSYSGGLGYLSVEYGIEDVFIPEDTGEAIQELTSRDGILSVEVKVDRWGNGIARRLLLDGEPYKFERR